MRQLRILPGLLLCLGAVPASGQTIIVFEDFEAGSPPIGWTTSANTPSVGWEFGTALGSAFFSIPNHTRYAASNDDAHDDNSAALNLADRDRLITPVMDFTPYSSTGVVVSFEYFHPGTYGSTAHVEVSTNGGASWTEVAALPAVAAWTSDSVDLSAYTSSSTVQVAFRHNDHNGWADGFAVDDVTIRSLQPRDAAVVEVTVESPRGVGSTIVSADVENLGGTVITSLELNYSVNGGPAVTDSLSGLAIQPLAVANVVHGTQVLFDTPGDWNLCVWTSDVNGGGPDNEPANDQLCKAISVLSSVPLHYVLLEHHTGAWCQFCPDGTARADEVAATYGEAIVATIHTGDAMEIPDGAALSTAYISSYPSATIDRFKFPAEGAVEVNRGAWMSRVPERKNMVVPVALTLEAQSWDAATRLLQVTVRADFVGSLSGDIRLNAYVLEDLVTGTGSGYDQVNFYDTVAGHPYFGAGNPIVGFEHNDVLRAALGGPWGLAGVIPSVVADGESYAHTFSYTLPAGFDETEIELVGLVQMYSATLSERYVLNSFKDGLVTVGCTLLGGAHQTLQDDTLLEARTLEVCNTITLGPNYEVAGPGGFLTLGAGEAVIFADGFSVGVDGRLVVTIDPGLKP